MMRTSTAAAEDRLRELREEYPDASAKRLGELYKAEIRRHIDIDNEDIEFQVMAIIDDMLPQLLRAIGFRSRQR